MPIVVTLVQAKMHLRVSHSDEDAYILGCLDAAEDLAAHYMNRPLAPWDAANNPVPASVKQAILLAVGDFYENRETASQEGVYNTNSAFRTLLNFHRKNMGI